ncbi:hypothetical protein RJ55_02451 [Drechmeria coniospora]|nr:hypothetical protein RJ55_02451 [Drechmeria coniospora]
MANPASVPAGSVGVALSGEDETPHRQIRALYDDDTITVYQAYNHSIADAAVEQQKLNASPHFRPGRMTWIKPSWAWMMYRAGYSFKDAGQSRILALRMKHDEFFGLLRRSILANHCIAKQVDGARDKAAVVRVQWDPERTVKLDVLPYRSIQIGIPGSLSGHWADECIVSIEDVTDQARELKKTIDERPDITTDELIQLGLVPRERPFPVSDEIALILEMDATRDK